MQDLTNELNQRIKEEEEYQQNEIKKGHDRMKFIEDLVTSEREDRVKSLEEQLTPIRVDLKDI